MPSTPGSLRLYGLFNEWLGGMAVIPGTPGTPTGSLPNLKCLQDTPTNSPTVASLLVGTLGLPSVPGHVDVGTRLLSLEM